MTAKLRNLTAILLLAIAPAFAQSSFVRSSRKDAIIEIYAAKTADYKIPRTIYGTFLEPIGESIYPGLWAQLLANPSFEGGLWSLDRLLAKVEAHPALEHASRLGLPFPWEPFDPTQGTRYEPRWGDAANSSRSLLIMGLSDREVGVRQEIFLPVHRILRYRGSVYIKTVSGPCQFSASLCRHDSSDVLARASIDVKSPDWTRYEFTLGLSPQQLAPLEPADFVLAITNEARVLIDQAVLFPADAIDGLDPDMVAMSKALKTPLVRFGGNFTSGYHWRDGIGPIDKRVNMINVAWGMPEYNHFGTDEFLHFCQLIGAEPQIALNLGSGTPEEAADWVRYVNAHWAGHRGGLLWELGNELWGNHQIGYPTLDQLAARTKAFSDAVLQVDPSARLIATGQDPDHFSVWNAAQLTNPPGTFQYLSTHFVDNPESVFRADPSSEFVAESAFALPIGLEQKLHEMKTQAGDKANLAFTEWLFHANGDIAPGATNMGGAICTAGLLNTFMRVANFTPISDMTGLIEFGGIWKKHSRVYGTPAYWAFRMYSTSDATIPVQCLTTAAAYDIDQGNHRLPEIHNVPYLDVVAAVNNTSDRLTLFVVNRHLTTDTRAHIHIAGFTPITHARVQILHARTILQSNDAAHPELVIPLETNIDIKSPTFDYTFPPASVTVIEIPHS